MKRVWWWYALTAIVVVSAVWGVVYVIGRIAANGEFGDGKAVAKVTDDGKSVSSQYLGPPAVARGGGPTMDETATAIANGIGSFLANSPGSPWSGTGIPQFAKNPRTFAPPPGGGVAGGGGTGGTGGGTGGGGDTGGGTGGGGDTGGDTGGGTGGGGGGGGDTGGGGGGDTGGTGGDFPTSGEGPAPDGATLTPVTVDSLATLALIPARALGEDARYGITFRPVGTADIGGTGVVIVISSSDALNNSANVTSFAGRNVFALYGDGGTVNLGGTYRAEMGFRRVRESLQMVLYGIQER